MGDLHRKTVFTVTSYLTFYLLANLLAYLHSQSDITLQQNLGFVSLTPNLFPQADITLSQSLGFGEGLK